MGSEGVVMGSEGVVMGSEGVVMGSDDVVMGSDDVVMGSDDVVMGSDELPGCGIASEHFWQGTGSTLSSSGLRLSLSINPVRVVCFIFNERLINLKIRESTNDTNLH
jgi:hypothetical protein